MRLCRKRFFLAASLNVVIFVACWIVFGSYTIFNCNRYKFNAQFVRSTTNYFAESYNELTKLKGSTKELNPFFNKSLSAENRSKTVISSILQPPIFLSTSSSSVKSQSKTVVSITFQPNILINTSSSSVKSQSKTVVSSTFQPPILLSTSSSSSVKSQSKTVVSSTLQPNILLNTSTSSNESANITWYITAHDINNGRLGNQMFKYASLLGLGLAQGRKMFIVPGSELEKTFNIKNVGDNQTDKIWTTIRESTPVSVDPKLMKLPLQNVKIVGFLQSFTYFSDIMDIVRQEFTFRDNIANEAAAIVNDVRAKYRPSLIVGVHARRGDYLKVKKNFGYGIPDKSYFLKAFDWMRSSFPGQNITFLVASDDLAWCKANLTGKDVVVMSNDPPAVHLAVLSSCNHVIISGGTFGWWGGWLAGGRVIYYNRHMEAGTVLGKQLKPEEYYPRLWIGMGD